MLLLLVMLHTMTILNTQQTLFQYLEDIYTMHKQTCTCTHTIGTYYDLHKLVHCTSDVDGSFNKMKERKLKETKGGKTAKMID